MKRVTKILGVLSLAALLGAGTVYATPSTHVWAPSTDIQAYGVAHITSDIYVPVKKLDIIDLEGTEDDGVDDRPGTITNLGLTVGVLPHEKIGLEVGFDHIEGQYPLYLNAKVGVPEGAYGELFPAIAVGAYSIGTKTGGDNTVDPTKPGTDYNILYAKAAKTIGNFGRGSAGFYTGNEKLLVDEKAKSSENGILLCWERTLSEVSENLWVAIDYMGGESSVGALSYGFAWKFAPNTAVIFGYVDQTNDNVLPGDTFTMQVDIDFDVFKKK